MKVVHFITNPYTFDTRVQKQCEALLEAGFEVACVGVQNKGFKALEHIRGIKVIRVNPDRFEWDILSRGVKNKLKAPVILARCFNFIRSSALRFSMAGRALFGKIRSSKTKLRSYARRFLNLIESFYNKVQRNIIARKSSALHRPGGADRSRRLFKNFCFAPIVALKRFFSANEETASGNHSAQPGVTGYGLEDWLKTQARFPLGKVIAFWFSIIIKVMFWPVIVVLYSLSYILMGLILNVTRIMAKMISLILHFLRSMVLMMLVNFLNLFLSCFSIAAPFSFQSFRYFSTIFRQNKIRFKKMLAQVAAGLAENADIYQANDFDTMAVGWICARLNNGYLVYDSHELYDESFPQRKQFSQRYLIRLVEGKISRQADACLTVCGSISEVLQQRYRLTETPVVVRNSQPYKSSLEPNPYILNRVSGLDGNLVCVYAGRITRGRGVEQIIEATDLVENMQVVLMGVIDSAFKPILEGLMEEHSQNGRIHVLPPVPAETLPDVLSVCDVGLMATESRTLSSYYGLGNKMFHYLNAGLAVLTVHHPEKRGIIEKFHNGAIVEPLTSQALAETIQTIQKNPEFLTAMKRKSRQAAQELAWENDRSKYLSIYHGLYEKALFTDHFLKNRAGWLSRSMSLARGSFYLYFSWVALG